MERIRILTSLAGLVVAFNPITSDVSAQDCNSIASFADRDQKINFQNLETENRISKFNQKIAARSDNDSEETMKQGPDPGDLDMKGLDPGDL
ncbi:hypothetical protein BJP34_17940 [Moorena producens PAL-8-15-08-1]|uniref:Uncharacterized protein n=1 Tax=Moorena producens PAL-8-15-08-1 TaxID=1458985 RepID=A0A1D8TTU8_9CYAN|nr:hypothetical protein [Moorena producens]AOX01069.1 hypothetical protein BJP34_17940 [Moorena producens PAL-8-15-08-1]